MTIFRMRLQDLHPLLSRRENISATEEVASLTVDVCPEGCYLAIAARDEAESRRIIETGHDIGCAFAAEMFPQHTKTSTPCDPKPPVDEGGPKSDAIATPPCGGVGSGQSTQKQPAGASDAGPGIGEAARLGAQTEWTSMRDVGRAEHPLYREIQEQADAAVVAELINRYAEHEGDDPYIYIQRVMVPVLATRIAEYISEK